MTPLVTGGLQGGPWVGPKNFAVTNDHQQRTGQMIAREGATLNVQVELELRIQAVLVRGQWRALHCDVRASGEGVSARVDKVVF